MVMQDGWLVSRRRFDRRVVFAECISTCVACLLAHMSQVFQDLPDMLGYVARF